MLRRLVTLLAAFALLASVGGCAALDEGADGLEAASILDRATKAQESIESMSFAMTMKGEAAGQTFSMQVDGGGYVKGEREGDMVVRASMAGAGLPAMKFQMVSLDGRGFMNQGGEWQEIPGFATDDATQAQLEQQLQGFDFAEYVSDIEVEKGTTFLGEPVTKIVGTIAIEDLMGGVFDQLGSSTGSLGGLGGLSDPSQLFSQVDMDDVRVAIYVSDVTNLVRAAHMEFAMEVEGQKATFDVDFSIDSVNEEIEIPEPAIVA
jgi:hypothetical protein